MAPHKYTYQLYLREEKPSNIELFRKNWRFEISMRGIKILDMTITIAIGCICGFIVGRFLSNFYFPFKASNYPDDAAGITRLFFEIMFELILIGIFLYIVRNLVELIPSPTEGLRGWNPPKTFKGYMHLALIELNMELPYMIFVIDADTSLLAKINLFIKYTGL